MSIHTEFTAQAATAHTIPLWQDLRATKDILRAIVADEPLRFTIVGKSLAGHRTERSEYHREDANVQALLSVRGAWFEMAEAIRLPMQPLAEVEEIIDAAIAAERRREALAERVEHWMGEGIAYGEAKRMAADDLVEGGL